MSAQHIFHELRRLVMGETGQEQAPQEPDSTQPDEDVTGGAPEAEQEQGEKPKAGSSGDPDAKPEEPAPTDRMNAPTE